MLWTWRGIFYLPLMTAVMTTTDQPQRTDVIDCRSLLKFDDQLYFIVEERIPMKGIPTDFNLNWRTNDLFFTLVTNSAEMYILILLNKSDEVLRPDRRFHIIRPPGVVGQTSAVDNKNNIIYLGTDNGVYTFNYTDKITLHSAKGKDVMYIAVTEDGSEIYIATFPYNRVEKINSQKQIESLPSIQNGHGIKSDRDYIYFYSATTKTPYILKKNTTYPRRIKLIRNTRNVFFCVAKTGQTQVMDINSNLYVINPENASAEFLGMFHIDQVSGFGMDSQNNIYIGTDREIIKFKAYKYNPCKWNNETTFTNKSRI